jgi:hypothetical protein
MFTYGISPRRNSKAYQGIDERLVNEEMKLMAGAALCYVS